MAEAAIGFADHSGWAIAVVVVRQGETFAVVARERLAILSPAIPRQPYHAVAEQGAPRSVIAAAAHSATECAATEIARIREAIARAGHDLVAAGVPAGTSRLPSSLDAILGSHTLLHAAEGELFREAIAQASASAGLAVTRIPRKEVHGLASAELGLPPQALVEFLAAIGKQLGPPWQADHKLAAVAAMMALSINSGGPARATIHT